jgi:hypothetical protein
VGKRFRACASGLLLALSGCVSRMEVPTDPATLDALRPRERTWVRPDEGPAYSGAFFRVESDSLILLGGDRSHIGTRLGHIRSVRVRRLDPVRTAWLAGGIASGFATLYLLLATGVIEFEQVEEDKGPVEDPTK